MENKRSSKEEMEQQLELLKSIQRVEAPDHLYERVMKRVSEGKMNIVPMRWVLTTAASLMLFFAMDAYLIIQNQKSKDASEIASLVPTQNNHLYDE